jgi:two-component system, NtrC family, response regulator HydG
MTNSSRILIVDDNEYILNSLQVLLKPEFDEVISIKNPNLIPGSLKKEWFDVILLDMNFSAGVNTGNEGLYWLREILKIDPDAIVIMITAYGDVELAVRAIREGATDFIQKPWDPDKLISTISTACKLRYTGRLLKNAELKHQTLSKEADKEFRLITGPSDSMKEVLDTIDKVADTDANILVLGENGTGKEVVAREIHRRSLRNREVFISVDLGSLTETLFESELFGHVKGAFTDAKDDRAGRFEIANGGTLFLDEIGNIPLHLQSRLLTVLERREISRVGSSHSIPVDIRLITATNLDPENLIKENRFREDLFYRVNTITIRVPPLRERREDISLLAGFFVSRFSEKYNKGEMKISSSAIKRLMLYDWPGNVREFINMIEKSVILCEGTVLGADDFYFGEKKEPSANENSLNLQHIEKVTITRAIEKYRGNMSSAARELGITRATLYSKINKYGL